MSFTDIPPDTVAAVIVRDVADQWIAEPLYVEDAVPIPRREFADMLRLAADVIDEQADELDGGEDA